MEKYAILLGYYDKQLKLIQQLLDEIIQVDLSVYEKRYVFALKTQQFYTAIEDLLKHIAKSFENHIEDLGSFHKAILLRMQTEIPDTRPAVLSKESYLLLDKVRAFRHFIRHAYDCELDESELQIIQSKIRSDFSLAASDFAEFRNYLRDLSGYTA